MGRPRKIAPIPGQEMFTEDELRLIQEEAAKSVVEDRKKEIRKKLLAQARNVEIAKHEPDEEMVDFHVDLPPFASFMMIDGTQYFHGQEYTFTRKAANSANDIIANAWKHEDVTKGNRDVNAYRREQRPTIGRNTNVNLGGHFGIMRV